MDFWRDKTSGALYTHGRICDGLCPDGDPVEGVLIHDAKHHKPIWMPFPLFKAQFEHVELRTSQEAWADRAHWYFLLAGVSFLFGASIFVTLLGFAWQGIATRWSAWPVAMILMTVSVLVYRRSRKLERDYQWDSWRRELKGNYIRDSR